MEEIDPPIPVFPARPGTYLLWLRLAEDARLEVGRLGNFDFPSGDYLYAGSAFGPGGLAARLGRHLDPAAPLHWHIDRLLKRVDWRGILFSTFPQRLECRWAQACADLPEANNPAPGFGSSDCRSGCRSHLIWLPTSPAVDQVRAALSLPGASLEFRELGQSKIWSRG